MTAFEVPTDLASNRGLVVDPKATARQVGAASGLFLCGEEFAATDEGISHDYGLHESAIGNDAETRP
jgi:hypothetical protein